MKPRRLSALNNSFDYRLPIIKQTNGYTYASNSKLRIPKDIRLNCHQDFMNNSSLSIFSITQLSDHSFSQIKTKNHKRKKIVLSSLTYSSTKNLKNVAKIPCKEKIAKNDTICGWDFE